MAKIGKVYVYARRFVGPIAGLKCGDDLTVGDLALVSSETGEGGRLTYKAITLRTGQVTLWSKYNLEDYWERVDG